MSLLSCMLPKLSVASETCLLPQQREAIGTSRSQASSCTSFPPARSSARSLFAPLRIGTGAEPDGIQTCPKCRGQGFFIEQTRMPLGFMQVQKPSVLARPRCPELQNSCLVVAVMEENQNQFVPPSLLSPSYMVTSARHTALTIPGAALLALMYYELPVPAPPGATSAEARARWFTSTATTARSACPLACFPAPPDVHLPVGPRTQPCHAGICGRGRASWRTGQRDREQRGAPHRPGGARHEE